jgi:hypothetical protein
MKETYLFFIIGDDAMGSSAIELIPIYGVMTGGSLQKDRMIRRARRRRPSWKEQKDQCDPFGCFPQALLRKKALSLSLSLSLSLLSLSLKEKQERCCERKCQ